MNAVLWFTIACGVLALAYGLVTSRAVLSASAGNQRMQEIAAAVQEGASAYLNRQYTTIGLVGVVIFVLIAFLLGIKVAIGFALGAASGLMGIGGGVLFMPILLYGFGLSLRNAAGTGVLLLFVTVAVGTFEQALRGYVSLELALAILLGSSVGSQLGALTTHVLPNRVLRLAFSVLVALTVVMIAWDLSRLLR